MCITIVSANAFGYYGGVMDVFMQGIQDSLRTHQVFGVRLHDLPETRLVALLKDWLRSDQGHTIVTPNPEIILRARKDHGLAELLNASDLSLPDGVGLRFAVSALQSEVLEHRHSGVDVFLTLAQLCQEEQKRLLLVGGSPGAAEKSAAVLAKAFPGLHVRGMDPGSVEGAAGHLRMAPDVAPAITELSPDVLAVGLGVGKQEEFVARALEFAPSLRIGIGVGGAFEMVSGMLPRAPERFRRMGLEWMWRLYLEPKRIGRIFRATVIFPVSVAYATIRERRFLAACKHVFPEVIRQIKGL